MKKLLIALFTLVPALAMAAGSNVPLMKAPIEPTNKVSLQNGAKLYMNYCFGCHQTQYQRYNRVAKDLDIPEELMKENLIFTGAKIGELMKNPVDPKLGSAWFGQTPPDLTNVTRVRGTDWVYTYLKSFYVDPERPFGVNNVIFKDVGMPHVLQELQGVPTLVGEEGHQTVVSDGSGEMSADEYDQAVTDLVNFLNYAGEPSKLDRLAMGKWVIGFLLIFFVLAYLLKKEYWRDVH